MDGVAAEVAQEIGVLLQHDDVDACAREQEAEHHPRGAAAGDAALRRTGIHRHSLRVRRHVQPGSTQVGYRPL